MNHIIDPSHIRFNNEFQLTYSVDDEPNVYIDVVATSPEAVAAKAAFVEQQLSELGIARSVLTGPDLTVVLNPDYESDIHMLLDD